MSAQRRKPGAEQERPTPHTEEHVTADGETGDRDPESEEESARVRRNLEGAAETVEDHKRDRHDG